MGRANIMKAMQAFGFAKRFLVAAACALTLALFAAASAAPAYAETIESDATWNVTFTKGSSMQTNYTATDIVEEVSGLQAGDTIKLAVNLINDNDQATNWYMTNRILASLEESATSAAGGAYTYNLAYIAPNGTRTTLFASDTVGGDSSSSGRQGLHEATGALEDYFLLGTLQSGQSAKVTLDVTLDGETQGNAYQNTLAQLALDFAVEPVQGATGQDQGQASGNPVTSPSTLPQTGDMLRMLPLFVICGVAGVVVLIAGIFGFRGRRKDEQEVR